MKKIIIMALSVMTLTACNNGKMQEENDAAQHIIDSLKAANSSQAAELDEMMDMINQVNEGFRIIKEAEGRVDVSDGNIEGDRKVQIAENMAFIQQTMQQNRELISQLKDKIARSGGALKSLSKQIEMLEQQMTTQKARIDELEAQLAERDQVIAQQTEKIDQLNDNVAELTTENEEKTATVAAQDKELNKAWFVFGTKSELKEQGILQKGEVLKSGNFNKGYFTQIDIRYDKDIRLYSKSAELKTVHPAGSYQLTKDSQGQYELHITNPTEFWSTSKYLVIIVK